MRACAAPTVLAAASTVAAVLVLLHARRRRLRAAWLASVRVTRGSIDDARGRIESLRPLVEECFPGMMDGDDGEDTVDQLCGFYEPDDCIALFADDEDGLCGLALLFPVRSARESSLYISAVCVRASCQGRGLGGRIMRTASTVAADEGLPTLAGSVQASEQRRCAPHLQPPAGGCRCGAHRRCSDACTEPASVGSPSSAATVEAVRMIRPPSPRPWHEARTHTAEMYSELSRAERTGKSRANPHRPSSSSANSAMQSSGS